MKSGATLRLCQAPENFALTVEDGANVVLEAAYDATAKVTTPVALTAGYAVPAGGQSIALSEAVALPQHDALNLEVLTIAAGAADVTADDFTDVSPKTYGLPKTTVTVEKDAGGVQHVYLSARPVVKSIKIFYTPEGSGYNYYKINGAPELWSDNRAAHEGADYLLVHQVNSLSNVEFDGDSLTISIPASSTTTLHVRETVALLRATLYPPTIIRPNYGGRSFDVYGDWTIAGAFDDAAPFVTFYSRYKEGGYLSFRGALHGEGPLKLTAESVGSMSLKNGVNQTRLYGDNSDYTGRLYVTHEGSPTNEYVGTQFGFNSAAALGGAPSTFRANAITIDKYSMMCPSTNITFDTANRGISGTGPYGFNVPTGVAFAVKVPIYQNNTMYKTGAGTLALGGAMTFGTNNLCRVREGGLTALSDAAVADNLCRVREGGLTALSDAAVAELDCTFADGTSIVLSPDSASVNGLRNVTVEDAAGGAAGKVNVVPLLPESGIDGVINYTRNMAEWAITISLFEFNEHDVAQPILGIVHAPALNLTYIAARGEGAIRIRRTPLGDKREKIMPSTTPHLEGSVVSFGMSFKSNESKYALDVVADIAGKPADIKRIGPVSLDLCAVDPGSEAGKQDWHAILKAVLPYVDLFVPSIEELCSMLDPERYASWLERAGDGDICEILDLEKDIRPIAKMCMDYGAKVLLLKCGAPGMYLETAPADVLRTIPRLDLDADAWGSFSRFEKSFVPDRIVSGEYDASGADGMLLSRWRTGGRSAYDLATDFVKNYESEPTADAWKHAALKLMQRDVVVEEEPRLRKLGRSEQTPKYDSPFWWAGYMVVDSGEAVKLEELDQLDEENVQKAKEEQALLKDGKAEALENQPDDGTENTDPNAGQTDENGEETEDGVVVPRFVNKNGDVGKTDGKDEDEADSFELDPKAIDDEDIKKMDEEGDDFFASDEDEEEAKPAPKEEPKAEDEESEPDLEEDEGLSTEDEPKAEGDSKEEPKADDAKGDSKEEPKADDAKGDSKEEPKADDAKGDSKEEPKASSPKKSDGKATSAKSGKVTLKSKK